MLIPLKHDDLFYEGLEQCNCDMNNYEECIEYLTDTFGKNKKAQKRIVAIQKHVEFYKLISL